MAVQTQVALITGASSGIGAATALAFVRAGFVTYATARRPETLAPLEAAGCHALRLDVTDEGSWRRRCGRWRRHTERWTYL